MATTRSRASPDDTLDRLLRALERHTERFAEQATRAIREGAHGYRDADEAMLSDVRAHVLGHYRTLLRALRERQPVTREDLVFVRLHTARRVDRISVADFVHAFQLAQNVLWAAIKEQVTDARSARAALDLVDQFLEYFEVATTNAAEVYLEHEQSLAAEGERTRRDLLGDLLAGRPIGAGLRLDAARAAGLEPTRPCLVISAVPTVPSPDEHGLRAAAAALGRATGAARPPLTVLRREEIVVVVADPPGRGRALGRRLEDARRRLDASGVSLAVGGSTVHDGVADLPRAYEEAVEARERVRPDGGALALTALTAFEYVTSRGDATARRLVSPDIRRFVAEDAGRGGVLLETLREYVASDLNVRRAAERLHVHVNTAHYRLSRIEERTGCDLRRIADVMEILTAAWLAGDRGSRGSTGQDTAVDVPRG